MSEYGSCHLHFWEMLLWQRSTVTLLSFDSRQCGSSVLSLPYMWRTACHSYLSFFRDIEGILRYHHFWVMLSTSYNFLSLLSPFASSSRCGLHWVSWFPKFWCYYGFKFHLCSNGAFRYFREYSCNIYIIYIYISTWWLEFVPQFNDSFQFHFAISVWFFPFMRDIFLGVPTHIPTLWFCRFLLPRILIQGSFHLQHCSFHH